MKGTVILFRVAFRHDCVPNLEHNAGPSQLVSQFRQLLADDFSGQLAFGHELELNRLRQIGGVDVGQRHEVSLGVPGNEGDVSAPITERTDLILDLGDPVLVRDAMVQIRDAAGVGGLGRRIAELGFARESVCADVRSGDGLVIGVDEAHGQLVENWRGFQRLAFALNRGKGECL